AERPFEARLKTYAANWLAVGSREVASTPPSPAPSAAAKVPNNLYFPSAKSIPPVNIMTAEPPPAQRQPQDTTGAAQAATPPPPAARPAAAGSAAASAGERRTRAFSADAACSRAITAPIF